MLGKIFKEQAAPPWSILSGGSTVLMMFAALIIGATVASLIFEDTVLALLSGWSMGMVLSIGLIAGTRGRSAENLAAMGLERGRANLAVIAVFALGMAILLDLISWVIVQDRTLSAAELIRLNPAEASFGVILIALIFMMLLQPLAEELVFRGILFPALSVALGGMMGFFGTAVVHGLFHALAYAPPPDNQAVFLWYGLILPMLDGVVFTGIRAYTGSTRASGVAHAVFGIFALLKVLAFAG